MSRYAIPICTLLGGAAGIAGTIIGFYIGGII